MNKAQLIQQVAENMGGVEYAEGDDQTRAFFRRKATTAVETVLSTIVSSVAMGHTVAVTGFGTFAVKSRPTRIARNPQTGGRVQVPPVMVPSFKAGRNFKDLVDGRKVLPLDGSVIAKAPKGSKSKDAQAVA